MFSRVWFINRIVLSAIFMNMFFAEPSMGQPSPSEEAETAFKKADEQLNAAYKKLLMAITKPEARDAFIQAQRAWITFRDAEAGFRTNLYDKGGIVWAYDYTVERTKLTKERTQQLQHIKAEFLAPR